MPLLKKSNSKATSSRRQIAIKGVEGNILELPNNEFRLVIAASAINIELKSEAEQDAIIDTYQRFLNSLPCTIQIVEYIKEIDIEKYLEGYESRLHQGKAKINKEHIEQYKKFVRGLVKTNKILTKQFYIVIPYKHKGKPSIDVVQDQLNMYYKIVETGLKKIGIHTRQLSGIEMLELFYNFYNPEMAKFQPLRAQTIEMLSKQYI